MGVTMYELEVAELSYETAIAELNATREDVANYENASEAFYAGDYDSAAGYLRPETSDHFWAELKNGAMINDEMINT